MPLPIPNLDDRTFAQLLAEAQSRVARDAPGWTDLTPGDPGEVLLELFSFLTESMIYRLNRLPEKAYISFLRLLGVVLQPPAAASVNLHFSRSRASDQPIPIPAGTQVTFDRPVAGREPPVFVTAETVTLASGQTEIDVLAYHCDLVDGELAGKGTGQPGLSITALRPPIIAPTGDGLDLVVGVEATPDELQGRVAAREFEGKTYRIWREVENFSDLGPDPFVYMVDRMTGTITFAPAARSMQENGELQEVPQALAAVPGAGREIRLWYRRGGGPEGNEAAANTLTKLRIEIPGVQVTNPNPATGGRAMETLDNALIRGPQELHSLERAVTASDFELIATKRSPSVARATAFTRAALWTFAAPGTVEILLVPNVSDSDWVDGKVTVDVLLAHETEEARQQIQAAIDERRPLGTTVLVNWTHYKPVAVSARVVVRREEDPGAVKRRVLNRLNQTISPLPTDLNSSGWRFGEAMHVSNVYDMALAEPGVRWVDNVSLIVDAVPENAITSVTADFFQPQTWYAGTGTTLYRTLNNGNGWEPVGTFLTEQIDRVQPHPNRAGLIAIAASLPDNKGSRIHLSRTVGETWEDQAPTLDLHVNDLAWINRDGAPILLMATNGGLYELSLEPGSTPVQVLVDPARLNQGFYAVTSATEAQGTRSVAVAAESMAGVYLSSDAGRTNSFRQTGLQNEDIRVLEVQYDGPRSFLWAGEAAPGGDDPGKGCYRWELRGAQNPPEGWQAFGKNWAGGSCRALAFQGTVVLAGTHHNGVVRLDSHASAQAWQPPDINCGLPLRDREHFLFQQVIMAGGPAGVYRSQDNGATYQTLSSKEFSESVTLPSTWLFVSGEHDITVVSEDEAR
jgi:hypothetical protein